jgi:hypothetical protein
MPWEKLGRVFCPDGTSAWASHSFMTPVPIQLDATRIRVFGGMRDASGVSRIGWVDVAADDPTQVLAVCDTPALDTGLPGAFDDNGVILGDVIWLRDDQLRMYYVGFQLVQKAKFLAFTGVAESTDGGQSFQRVQITPVLDRAPHAPFINALHSIEALEHGGYRAWVSCGQRWQLIDGLVYPQYNCWTLTSEDGLWWDNRNAIKILDVSGDEYRIGRPRANRLKSGGYELRITSDTLSKQYATRRLTSDDGIHFAPSAKEELPRGTTEAWDSDMTCYPARLDSWAGQSFLFYNGNGMGRTGLGVARWTHGAPQ